MVSSLFVAAVLAFVVGWTRLVLAPTPTLGRLWPALVVPLLLPFVSPLPWVYPQALLTVLCIVMAGKAYELFRGRVPDPAMLGPLPSFVFWQLVPLKARAPRTALEASHARAKGRARLLRATFKLPGVAALTIVHLSWPGLHDGPWLEAFWALWITYLGVSALVDVVGGLAMQSGNALAEGFNAPPLARSPRDFWSRRWNLVVHDLVFRHVFLPLGGLRRPLRGTIGVFVLSGLIHEYFIVACMGRASSYPGWMMLFFGLHGIAVMAQLAWDRGPGRRKNLPRALAIVLHLGWFTLTAPLFFFPMGEVFAGAWPN